MKKLIDTYDKYLELGDVYYLLGLSVNKDLVNYCDKNLVKQFLYCYSHLGLSAIEILSIDKLKERLEYELKTLNNYSELCNEKKWWCLSLIYLRIGTEYYNLYFFSSVINSLLDMAKSLSIDDLIKYCNTINDCLGSIIGFELRIRPSQDNNISTYISKEYLNITTHSNDIIKIFKEFFTVDAVTNEDVNKELLLLKKIGCEFDQWEVVFDIFVGQLLVSLDSPLLYMGDLDRYENAVESALLNLTSKNEFLPQNLNIVCKKVAETLT